MFISVKRFHGARVALLCLVVARGANLDGRPDVQLAHDTEGARTDDHKAVELAAGGDATVQRSHVDESLSAARPLMRSQAVLPPSALHERADPESEAGFADGTSKETVQSHKHGQQRWQVDANAQTHQFSALQREAEEEATRLLSQLHQATRDRVEEMQNTPEHESQRLSNDIVGGLRSHHVLDFSEARVPPTALTEAESSFGVKAKASLDADMVPGMNAADLAYKAMDLLYGTSGIIPEDYPYACICGASGLCEGDTMKTTCKGRKGTGSGAQRTAGSLATIVPLVVVAAGTCGLSLVL